MAATKSHEYVALADMVHGMRDRQGTPTRLSGWLCYSHRHEHVMCSEMDHCILTASCALAGYQSHCDRPDGVVSWLATILVTDTGGQ